MLIVFGVLLGISFVGGLVRHLMAAVAPHHCLEAWQALAATIVIEVADTALVLLAWAWCGARFPEPRRSLVRRVLVWMAALAGLVGVLALNVLYHRFICEWLHLSVERQYVFRDHALTTLSMLAICAQPPIVEELFFRYLMFGALRRVMGGNGVVWITAVMFATAHIGVPLSMPVLFVLGLLLGYARLGTGTIWLPIALHFLHNAAVVALNAMYGGLQ